jgi:hypothetical protein
MLTQDQSALLYSRLDLPAQLLTVTGAVGEGIMPFAE